MKRSVVYYSPDVILKRMTLDGIRFFKSTFPVGSSFTYMYLQDAPYNQIASTHYQVRGRMTGGGMVHTQGWCSRDDATIIPYGPLTLTAEEESVRWCCVGLADNETTSYISVVRMNMGEILELNANDNLLILTGRVITSKGHVVEGQHIKATQLASVVAAQDTVAYSWNTTEVQLIYSVDPLECAKAERWELIKGIRTLKDKGGFMYLDKWFDSHTAARQNISDAVQLASLSPNYRVEWTLADDSAILLDAEMVKGLGIALGVHVTTNHAIARSLRQQIISATSIEEVEGVKWP